MILPDTSVWADYLGRGDDRLAALLQSAQVLLHPFVLGEIALGSLRRRATTLADLTALPTALLSEPHELLRFIDRHALFGSGIGYVDTHLLASTLLAPGTRLWTRDKRPLAAAERLDLAYRF